jgi:hypothetical protein
MITAGLIPLVYVVYILLFVVAYPISILLDVLFGYNGGKGGITLYNRKEIATLLTMQQEESQGRGLIGGSISHFSFK